MEATELSPSPRLRGIISSKNPFSSPVRTHGRQIPPAGHADDTTRQRRNRRRGRHCMPQTKAWPRDKDGGALRHHTLPGDKQAMPRQRRPAVARRPRKDGAPNPTRLSAAPKGTRDGTPQPGRDRLISSHPHGTAGCGEFSCRAFEIFSCFTAGWT